MRSLIGEGVRTILKIIRKEFSKLRIKKSKSCASGTEGWYAPLWIKSKESIAIGR